MQAGQTTVALPFGQIPGIEVVGLRVARATSVLSVVFRGDLSQLSNVRAVDDGYPLRGRVTSVFHASYIRTDDMLRTLQRFLRLDDATLLELRPHLEQLQGRPIFFFNDFH